MPPSTRQRVRRRNRASASARGRCARHRCRPRQALDQRRFEFGRGQPAVIADRDAPAAGLGQHARRRLGRWRAHRPRTASRRRRRGCRIRAGWSDRNGGRHRHGSRSAGRSCRMLAERGAELGMLQPEARHWPRDSRPCRRNRSAGPRSAAHGTAGRRRSARSSPSVSWISLPAPGLDSARCSNTSRLEDIAADDRQGRRRLRRLGLLDHALAPHQASRHRRRHRARRSGWSARAAPRSPRRCCRRSLA